MLCELVDERPSDTAAPEDGVRTLALEEFKAVSVLEVVTVVVVLALEDTGTGLNEVLKEGTRGAELANGTAFCPPKPPALGLASIAAEV